MNVPEHVAIVGMGPSVAQYVRVAMALGGKSALCDEVWGINALGDVLKCDRIFHMDDVRVQEIRAAAKPESNIAAMLRWMKQHDGVVPIITSIAHEGYPGTEPFPLEAFVNHLGYAYLNNTAAYAVAYAVHIGVKKISVFGCDFTYPDAHDAEKGRGCVEFWLGQATARGIEVQVPGSSSLMDACVPPDEKQYGYDMVDVRITGERGDLKVEFEDRAKAPTADEMEDRYDHSKHPNPQVSER